VPVLVATAVGVGLIRPAIGAGDSERGKRESRPHPALNAGQSCTSCHDMDRDASHPVDVVPSMPVPATLPLFGGVMTCATCHAEPGSEVPTRAMLRAVDSPGGMCVQCHTPGGSSRGAHADPLIKAHAIRGEEANRGARPVWGGLDGESRTCLACHDGGIGGDAAYHGPELRRMAARGVGEHPVGIVYDERRPSNPDTRLKPASSLSHAVRLVDGTVSCVTCHSVYSREQSLLTKNNRGSELCLTCHIQ